MEKNLLEVKKLSSKSKNRYVYKNINFTINKNEIVGLLGHNGAGKSTMLRNIANLESPQEGEIYIDGILNDTNTFNNNIVLVPDIIKLNKTLNIEENLQIISSNYGYDKHFYEEYLKIVKLSGQEKICELSKGNQEIVQLIIMFSLNTKLIILDEPFSAIDIFRRELITKMIIDCSSNKSIIITTHLIADVENILTRILYLDNSKMIMDLDVEEIQIKSDSLVNYLKDYFKGGF